MVDYFELLKNKLAIPENVYNTGNEKIWGEFEKNTGIILPEDLEKL